MGKVVIHPNTLSLADLQAQIATMQEDMAAQSLVLAWLLENQPEDNGIRFLCRQANHMETEDPGKYRAIVQLFDELRALCATLRAQSASDREHPR